MFSLNFHKSAYGALHYPITDQTLIDGFSPVIPWFYIPIKKGSVRQAARREGGGF